jgi:GTP-binding protein HflX
MNKIDLIDQVAHYVDAETDEKLVGRVYVSAQEDQGLDLLKEQLSHYFADQLFEGVLCLAPRLGKLRATLYQEEAVQKETISEKGEFLLSLRMQKKHLQRVLNTEDIALDSLLMVTP